MSILGWFPLGLTGLISLLSSYFEVRLFQCLLSSQLRCEHLPGLEAVQSTAAQNDPWSSLREPSWARVQLSVQRPSPPWTRSSFSTRSPSFLNWCSWFQQPRQAWAVVLPVNTRPPCPCRCPLPCAVARTGEAVWAESWVPGCLCLTGITVLPRLLTRKPLYSFPRAAADSVTYNRNAVSCGSGHSHPERFHWVRIKACAGWRPSRRIGLLRSPAFKAAFLGSWIPLHLQSQHHSITLPWAHCLLLPHQVFLSRGCLAIALGVVGVAQDQFSIPRSLG